MFKGAKKAIARTPHRFLGSKSIEDRNIIDWTKDFEVAHHALGLLQNEANSYQKETIKVLSSTRELLEVLSGIYKQVGDKGLETPASQARALKDYLQLSIDLENDITKEVGEMVAWLVRRSKDLNACIEGMSKLLKKRNHKKQDFDRFANNLEKLVRKSPATSTQSAQNHETQVSKAEAELESAREIFHAIDQKVKSTVPRVIAEVSEMLNLLTAKLYMDQLKIYDHWKSAIYQYAQEYGTENEQFSERFEPIRTHLEQSLNFIREGKTVSKPLHESNSSTKLEALTDKTVEIAANSVTKTSDIALKAAGKTTDASQIHFSSPANGFFTNELDPLTLTSPSHTPPPGYTPQLRSPVTSSFPDPPSTLLDLQARVRASMSNTARALTPPYSDESASGSDAALDEGLYDTVALYTFHGSEPGDISFRVGERVKVLDEGDSMDKNWWMGRTVDGRMGLFPSNYVERI